MRKCSSNLTKRFWSTLHPLRTIHMRSQRLGGVSCVLVEINKTNLEQTHESSEWFAIEDVWTLSSPSHVCLVVWDSPFRCGTGFPLGWGTGGFCTPHLEGIWILWRSPPPGPIGGMAPSSTQMRSNQVEEGAKQPVGRGRHRPPKWLEQTRRPQKFKIPGEIRQICKIYGKKQKILEKFLWNIR